ncbi:MAG: MBL fold metallo-hydrolase [Acidimicrobiales bacterium]|nr:MBL fold metallo-hydrolase [Acidimicrobiales bacterium]
MSAPTATAATRAAIDAMAASLPTHDRQDFEDATRGFVGRADQRQVTANDGRVVWDLDAYEFLRGAEAPDTANPSLWRQGQLLIEDGLFEVVPGIYQLRGFDLSVMSVIEGDSGVIVIDPLISSETAAAAFALYTEHRGERPVRAMIYTHSHVDHFGGVKGIITQEQVDRGEVQVIAPEGFLHHAIAENVFAGTAMTRRAGYMYGAALERGPAGQIGAGLGQTTSTGEITLIRPTIDITHTGEVLTVDGVEIVFQVTPGTEAPAEMNFYFPQHRALCTAENTSHTLHNILTIRGALVRDAHAWAHYLTETIDLWGDELDVVFASHHWPTWGRERAVEFLAMQRDMYLYLHDQTLRMMNQGFTGAEIAEVLEMPPALEQQWHTHGYYGSVSHNVKAIYQRYMGWYDANPANLWPHPPEAVATRYVQAMGGRDGALAVARRARDDGDYRWCAEVGKHLVFADGSDADARALLADALEQLGFGAECGTWRNAFLAGATELRSGSFGTPVSTSADMLTALTVEQVLDSVAIRIDGPRAWDERLQIAWRVTDEDTSYLIELRNGALHQRTVTVVPDDVTTFTLTRPALIGLVTGTLDIGAAMGDGTVQVDGDPAVLARLVALLGSVDPDFDIVTP